MTNENKLSVGILTTFYEWNPSYSLTSVVEAQLVSLVKYGYNPILYVLTNFKDQDKVPKGVEVKCIVPQFKLVDYSGKAEPESDLFDQAEAAYKAFKKHLDVDIVIQHDLIFQGWFLPYCMAIHKLASESNIKWLHWMHSNPSFPLLGLKEPLLLRYRLPANSKLVYLNNSFLQMTAESYSAWPKDVRIVYNPVDTRLFWNLHPLVRSLIDKYGLLDADFLQVYPVSSTRMVDGKQIYTVINIMSKLKAMGKKVRLIICNAHANADREKQTIQEALSYAGQKGLSPAEVIFTSLEQAPLYEHGVPKEVVSQLFTLGNLFIFPSTSENCSLILLEAMLSKNLLVLNEDLPQMREFAKENALYFPFGSINTTRTYTDIENFLNDVAKVIVSEFNTNRALKASNDIKQHFNFDFIFQNSIEPLFYES